MDTHRIAQAHTPLGPTLMFRQFTGREEISSPFDWHLELLADKNANIDPDSLLGQDITIELKIQGGGVRFFNGHVTRFAFVGREVAKESDLWRYEARLRPWLWYLTRESDFKIFQNKTVPEILDEVFGKYPFPVEKKLGGGRYRKWEYCVQYQETDFNFVSRLMEHEGIYYFFKHEMDRHTLVLVNDLSKHETCPGYATVPYIPSDRIAIADEEYIESWQVAKEVDSGTFITDDYDWEKPQAKLLRPRMKPYGHPHGDHPIYEWPGGYIDLDDGENYAKLRLEELQAPHESVTGQGNARGLAPGYRFTLKTCPRKDQNREYLILGVNYFIRDNPYHTGGEGPSDWRFALTAQPTTVPFRPPRVSPKPLTNGPQTAVVVGKAGEEIWTDKYGRVKVQFHWDQYGNADENSSCWIRVSHPWAGSNWGGMFMPRIGQEVIVDFIGGDPDYPIITGRVYNADHMPPYELPKYQEYSTIKSHSTKHGSGTDWNELRFVDYKGKEQVFIHANWRMDVRVKWKKYETVKESSHFQMGACYVTTGGVHDWHVGGDLHQRVDGKIDLSAGGNIGIVAESSVGLQATSNVEVNAKNITIEGSVGVTLKCGGNFIKLDPGGVVIQGTMVRINSGGVGTGTGPVEIEDPYDAESADDGTPGYLDKPKTGGWGKRKKRGGPGQHAGKGYASAEAAAVASMQAYNPASVAENREYGGWIKKNPDGTFSPQPAVRGSEAGLDNMPAKGPNDAAWWHTHGAVVPDGHGGDKYDSENFSGNSGDHGYSKANNAPGYVATPSGAIKKYDPAQDGGTGPRDGETVLPDKAPP